MFSIIIDLKALLFEIYDNYKSFMKNIDSARGSVAEDNEMSIR